MKTQHPPPFRPHLKPRHLHIALGLLLAASPALALPAPIYGGLTIGSVITFIGTVAGTVSMFTNINTYQGDYEQQETKLKVSSYYDQCDGLYQGIRWAQTREFWVDPNGQSCYKITHCCKYADGTLHWQTYSDAFLFYYERRDYFCSPQSGYWYRVESRTSLNIGYEVTKPARMAQHTAPNPLRVAIGWYGIPLQTNCTDNPAPFWRSTLTVAAPRNAYTPVAFPRNNFELDMLSTTMVPYLR